MFQYLTDGTLTDDDDQDRLTLLMADQYFIENEALYRLTAPRNKKTRPTATHDVRLCHIHMTSLATSMIGLDTWGYRDCS